MTILQRGILHRVSAMCISNSARSHQTFERHGRGGQSRM